MSDPAELLAAPAGVRDPRKRRGVRHAVVGILVIAVCAVLAGARSFSAIAEWAADTARPSLAELGVGIPHASTIRRVLAQVDPEELDSILGVWVRSRTQTKLVAVDGKEVRGAKNARGTRVHLLAALDHNTGAVIGQVNVDGKTNEIPMFSTLLDTLGDLNGLVVTADALHAQRSHAEYLHERNGHYLVTVKGNQRALHRQLKALPWRQAPVGNRQHGRGHGKVTTRSAKVVTVEAGLQFPHAAQAIQIIRRTRPLNGTKWRVETVYGPFAVKRG